MNVHISYRLHKTPAVEKDIQHQIEKLRKRLQVFRPELIHLKGMVEEVSAREGISVSLNLRLPSGQMAVQSKSATAAAAVKTAFEDLLQQLNKHKELLRSTHKWTRRQKDASSRKNLSVPFEDTLAVVYPEMVSAEDIRSYVNVNLSRLERFVEREIYFRETADQVVPDSIGKDEVIDETIAAALGGDGEKPGREKPERLALEPWLYRLALDALDQLSRPEGTNGGAVRLEESARKPNVRASDEPVLQFHQPDETIPALNGYWPDVVFMNFSLKNGTAVDLCSDIRELFGELPPVVIHSPKAEHRFFALRFPEVSFLSSPFTQDDLRGAFDHLAPSAAVSLTG